MSLSTIRNDYNQALTDLSAFAQKEMTPENRSAFDKASARVSELRSDLQRFEAAEQAEQELRAATRPPRSNPSEQRDQNNNANERSAFEAYMRYGTPSTELRSLGAGPVAGNVTVSGGVFIPTGVGDTTIAQKSYGTLASAVKQLSTETGNPVRLPYVDDTANGLTEIAELTDAAETDPSLGGVNSTVDDLTTGIVTVSNDLLTDSAYSIDALITSMFQDRVVAGLNQRIWNGNGKSFAAITAGVPLKVTTAASGVISYTDLVNLFGSLDLKKRAVSSWIFSSATHAALMGQVSTTGQPILQPSPQGDPFMSLLGRPVVISELAPAPAANALSVYFGDLSSYTLRIVKGARIARSSEAGFKSNSTLFTMFLRAGGIGTSVASVPSIVSLKVKA